MRIVMRPCGERSFLHGETLEFDGSLRLQGAVAECRFVSQLLIVPVGVPVSALASHSERCAQKRMK